MNSCEREPLDKMIEQAIDGRHVELDFEAWKEKHQIDIHLFRMQRAAAASRSIRGSFPWWAVTAAATLVVAVGLLVLRFSAKPAVPPRWTVGPAETPGQMMSILHLNVAFRTGGLESVEDQYKSAYARLGPRLSLELGDLFENGS